MKQIKHLIFGLLITFLFSSCEQWLDVKPEDRIMENKLYETKEGFITALNGIYIDMINTSTYNGGIAKSMDVMAQLWDIGDKHSLSGLAKLEKNAKGRLESGVWTSNYKLLNNINTLLEHCENNGGVLDDKYYAIIRGEALALRAMLHFDMVRIYGPIYSKEDYNKNYVIPFANSSEFMIRPLLKADEIAELIIDDYINAEKLLKKYDPIIEEGVLASDKINESNNLRYRNFRMNYYAVKALIARAYLHFNEIDKAKKYAEEVISEAVNEKKIFYFQDKELTLSSSNPDRIYSSEALFSIYNIKRYDDWFLSTYSNDLNSEIILTMQQKYVDKLYDGFEGDIRLQRMWEKRLSIDAKEIQCFVKYDKVSDDLNTKNPLEHQYMIPIIKLSELYLIIAEATYMNDENTAVKNINKIRFARNVVNIPQGAILFDAIVKETAREFIGEGLLFYLYKRNNIGTIHSFANETEISMKGDKYYLSIPESEKNARK